MDDRILDCFDNVIFDLDGTLATLDVDWTALRTALAREFPDVIDERPAVPLMECLQRVTLSHGPAGRTRAFGTIRKYEQPHGAVHYRKNQVAIDAAERLPRFFVITNNLRSTALQVLEALDLARRCGGIVGLDDAAHPKPHRAPYEVLLESTGPLGRTGYVGDRHSDRIFAMACEMEFVDVQDL